MMKNVIIALMVCTGFVSCEKQPIRDFVKGEPKTEEVTFRDPGMCSGMFFERDCGDILEVYNYYPDDMGFCGTPYVLQPGERIELTYRCYDNTSLIQCEALSAYQQQCYEEDRNISTVEVIHQNN